MSDESDETRYVYMTSPLKLDDWALLLRAVSSVADTPPCALAE